LSSITTKVDK